MNLFVDRSQLQIECLRRGIRGLASLWAHIIAPKEQKHKLCKTVALNVN